ncbi:MAG TPA: GspE/PulE family protein [Candidatus Limnocylindrales bacterium]|nr:GspE/PulE family protein [Candidatus Limnocylindrales bacterium]
MRLGSRPKQQAAQGIQAQPPPVAPRVQPRRPTELSLHSGGRRLGEILVDSRMATTQQVITALTASQRGTAPRFLGELLVEAGVIDERTLTAVVARQRGLELVDLREVSPQPQATALLDEAAARDLGAIPLEVRPDGVDVAVAFPLEGLQAILSQAIGRPVRLRMAMRSDILRVIGTSYRALAGIDSQVLAFEATHTRLDTRVAEDASEDAPIVRVVQMIITQALRDRASDIHIEPHPEKILVRYRIDGALHDMLDLPMSMGPVVVSRVKILAGLNIVERRRAQDGQISMEIEGRSVDIRVSTTAVIEGEKVVMRLLDKSRQLFRLPQLGMPPDMVARYSGVLRAPYGMVICAGPTGSGKTTTLYGSLGEINSPERNVMTIEDPVEYRIPATNQIQINEQAGITFAGGLRSILRQDPDVILVGEIRDVETARIAVQAALTGHFVLSSLHATDTAAALHRLLDMGIEGFLIASSVTAVMSQRLVRRICEHCRETYYPSTQELGLLRAIDGREPPGGFVRGRGCNFCAQTGFLDRIGVYELMPVSDKVRQLIVERASHDEIRRAALNEGMRTLQQEAARLVETSVTTPNEVLRSIYVVGN